MSGANLTDRDDPRRWFHLGLQNPESMAGIDWLCTEHNASGSGRWCCPYCVLEKQESGAEFTRFSGGGGPPRNKAGEATAPRCHCSVCGCAGWIWEARRKRVKWIKCPQCKGKNHNGVTQLAECQPHKLDVAGSSPVPVTTIRGGATPKLRAPMGAFLLFTLMGAVLSGCGPRKVLTSLNAFEFHNERQKEECITSSPVCDCRWEALQVWRKRLTEAGEAVKRGGGMPLQLKALKASEAAHGACGK